MMSLKTVMRDPHAVRSCDTGDKFYFMRDSKGRNVRKGEERDESNRNLERVSEIERMIKGYKFVIYLCA